MLGVGALWEMCKWRIVVPKIIACEQLGVSLCSPLEMETELTC